MSLTLVYGERTLYPKNSIPPADLSFTVGLQLAGVLEEILGIRQ